MKAIKVFSYVTLSIFLYYFTYYIYRGIVSPIPELGDSFDYHIPISKTIIDGSFLNLHDAKFFQWYYPGSSEGINSVFILLGIPLTLSNLFAILVLLFVCYKLARRFKLDKYYSLLFTLTICTLTAITRWFNSVSIDVWIAVFYLSSVIVLEKPKRTIQYFTTLGFFFGMLIGSKYTAIIYIIPLVVVYGKRLKQFINIQNIIAFSIPFSVFGLFWYIRNYLLTQNPFYPLCYFNLPCQHIFTDYIYNIAPSHPNEMFNAFFSEYKFWGLTIFLLPIIMFLKLRKKIIFDNSIYRLLILGFANLIFLLFLPTSIQPWIMVSSFRYSYTTFIPLILIVFILSQKYDKKNLIGFFVVINILPVLSLIYYPKLLFFYFPIFVITAYVFEKYVSNRK